MNNDQVDEQTQREFQQFVALENQKAVFQSAISKLTEVCWDKCITKPGKSMSGSETKCLQNCAARFLDSSIFLMQRMQRSSGEGQ